MVVTYAVGPADGWDVLWDFNDPCSVLPVGDTSVGNGAVINPQLTADDTVTIADGVYRHNDDGGVNSWFSWPNTYFDGDTDWTFDMKFRMTGENRQRYNLYGWVAVPYSGRAVAWNFDRNSNFGADLWQWRNDAFSVNLRSGEALDWHVFPRHVQFLDRDRAVLSR